MSFYAGLHDNIPTLVENEDMESKKEESEMDTSESTEDIHDDGLDNLDLLLNTMEKMETEQANLLNEAIALTEKFVTDVKSRINRRDTNYASGVVKFLAKYFNIIDTTEPTTSATPKLATFLHCDHNQKNPAHGGTRKIPVQPTALQRRRKGIPRGSQKAAQGRHPNEAQR